MYSELCSAGDVRGCYGMGTYESGRGMVSILMLPRACTSNLRQSHIPACTRRKILVNSDLGDPVKALDMLEAVKAETLRAVVCLVSTAKAGCQKIPQRSRKIFTPASDSSNGGGCFGWKWQSAAGRAGSKGRLRDVQTRLLQSGRKKRPWGTLHQGRRRGAQEHQKPFVTLLRVVTMGISAPAEAWTNLIGMESM